ncbi:hypothetical protein BLNAU_15192 [Blattamonas nauphoetae]|uniref:Uncharacterized protein n=1 Tax=Blattamonas nauphoetae TaxID=2049346 RepID=A0ABQ9XEQ4_9EUKA|nr:hypothetical protein BLNAU_15192 [Blattamonas nauphoetae]
MDIVISNTIRVRTISKQHILRKIGGHPNMTLNSPQARTDGMLLQQNSYRSGSTVHLSGVAHISLSSFIAPFVDISPQIAPLSSEISTDNEILPSDSADDISVVGVGLHFESTILLSGTGPLFSFGLFERQPHHQPIGCVPGMETDLIKSQFFNMSTLSAPNRENTRELMFGSNVNQQLIGCSVSRSSNHQRGTSMMDPNNGGSLLCQNTSFSSCISPANADQTISHEHRTQGSQFQPTHLISESVVFTLCTFNNMRSTASGDYFGGAAILPRETNAALAVSQCFFHKCVSAGWNNDGGTISFLCLSSNKRPFSLSLSSFTECQCTYNYIGCTCAAFTSKLASSSVVSGCFFHLCNATGRPGTAGFVLTSASVSNCTFVKCASLKHDGGALGLAFISSAALSSIQFRECSAYIAGSADVMHRNSPKSLLNASSIQFCDSTSGSPNIFFADDGQRNGTLVPQLETDDALFITAFSLKMQDGKCLVEVELSSSVVGTMGVLLEGGNVPRLIHVPFGSTGTPSTCGTTEVSVGVSGLLPVLGEGQTFSVRIVGMAEKEILGRIDGVEAELTSSTTATLTLSGVFLKTGVSSMLVKNKLGKTFTVSLPTNNGTALISFTVPTPPAAISSFACKKDDDWMTLSFTGSGLVGRSYTLTLTEQNPSGVAHRKVIELVPTSATTLSEENATLYPPSLADLKYGTTYKVTNVVSSISNQLVSLSTALITTPVEPSRVTSLSITRYSEQERKVELSVEGLMMTEGETYTLVVNETGTYTQKRICVTFSSKTEGSGSASLFPPSEAELDYNTNYTLTGVMDSQTNEILFISGLSFKTKTEPERLISISAYPLVADSETSSISLSITASALLDQTEYTLTLSSLPTSDEAAHFKTLKVTTDEHGNIEMFKAILYPFEDEERKKEQLEFDTTYSLSLLTRQSTPIFFESSSTTFHTDRDSPRIEKMVSAILSKDRSEVTLTFSGRALVGSLGRLVMSDGSKTWESLSDILCSSTQCSAVFKAGLGQSLDQLEFGGVYEVLSSDTAKYVVNSGVLTRVPFPPHLNLTSFKFWNSLNTSCVVVFGGSDLVEGTSYSVGLANSLSFVITVNSSAAVSSPLAIGWEDSLQFSTTYPIVSITPVNEEDGDITFEELSIVTEAKPSQITLSIDSSGSKSKICGTANDPCCSIEIGWWIVRGIGFTSCTFSIVHHTTLKERIRIPSDHDIVLRTGPSSKPELIVSPSSTLSEMLPGEDTRQGMIEVSGSRVWMNRVDIEMTDSSSVVFVRIVDGRLTLESCSITGNSSSSPEITNSGDFKCSWSLGAFLLVNTTTSVTSSTFSGLSLGAINMEGGTLSLRSTLNDDPQASPHFIPTLSSKSTSSFNKKDKTFTLEIAGTTLIPCGLFLEVFEVSKNKTEGKTDDVKLDLDTTTSFTESSISLSLSQSSPSSLDPSLEWRGRLMFGQNERSTNSFQIQANSVERHSQSVKENMKWWLPLAIILGVSHLLLILFIFFCWRRKKGERKNEDFLEKMEERDETMGGNANETTVQSLTDMKLTARGPEMSEKTEDSGKMESVRCDQRREIDVIEVMDCVQFDSHFVSRQNSLYNQLHVENRPLSNKRIQERHLVSALVNLKKTNVCAEVFLHLSTHWIKMNKDGAMCLLLEKTKGMETDEKEGEIRTEQERKVDGEREKMDGQRWSAPEQFLEEGEAEKAINPAQVSDFRLGLVLWEIETRQIPFGETDVVNTCRQLKVGIVPAMDGVASVSMRELITRCLSVEGDSRPTLESILSTLNGIDDDATTCKDTLPF